MTRRRIWLMTLCLGCLLGGLWERAASARERERRTTLSGTVRDPATNAGLAGATVRLHGRTAVADENGDFRIEVGRKVPQLISTQISHPGYLSYRTWTPKGGEFTSDVYLFPTDNFVLEAQEGGLGGEGQVDAATFLKHFNLVHRDEPQAGARLQRWVEQPRIRIGSHVLIGAPDGNGSLVTSEPVPPAVLRTARRSIRASLGPLTNGFLEAGKVRKIKLTPGDVLRTVEAWARRGELNFYMINARVSGGAALLEGDTIVSGFVRVNISPLRQRPDYPNSLLVHEMAHALGMLHPNGHGRVLLCSIMLGIHCEGQGEAGTVTGVTAVDIVTARLAYSRLPGNDRDDQDPARAVSASSKARVQLFDSPALLSSTEERRVPGS